MIEMYLLEQLLAFSQCGTLSAASEKLHVSQPALSHSMKKLEELMGVPLFERTKNRIALNENGKLAADCAAKILEQEREMIERVRLLDQSRRTITLGACAPVPVADLVPILSRVYSGMTIASEIRNSDEELLAGLEKNQYQILVLHEKPEGEELYFEAYREEHLMLQLPENHPLSAKEQLYLQEIDGQNLLLYTKIGFWYELCRQKLPNAHFLMMNEFDAFGEVAGAGAFPSFVTEAAAGGELPEGRKAIPILDEEANVTYYCVCAKKDKKRFESLYQGLRRFEKHSDR